jgi:hypothetical protein
MRGSHGSSFPSTASQHGGQETTLLTLATFFQGMEAGGGLTRRPHNPCAR